MLYELYRPQERHHFLNFQQSTQLKTYFALCIWLIEALVTELEIFFSKFGNNLGNLWKMTF